jgi:hypothetical protein
MLQIFCASVPGSQDQLYAIDIMTDCLRHHSMKIVTGKNQMVFKTNKMADFQSINNFCSIQNITEIVQRLILESNVKTRACDLVKAMLSIADC